MSTSVTERALCKKRPHERLVYENQEEDVVSDKRESVKKKDKEETKRSEIGKLVTLRGKRKDILRKHLTRVRKKKIHTVTTKGQKKKKKL